VEYPKISIVTPSFNKGEFIDRAIRSVIEQNYPNLEYVIVDGGSVDGTVEIIKKHEESVSWWVSELDRGQSHAINKGFAGTSGEIMAYLNADDMYCPWALETVAAVFAEFPQVEWITSLCPIIWDESSRPVMTLTLGGVTKACFYAGYTLGCSEHHMGWIQQESTFWRRSLWEKAGGYVSEELRFAMDFELWARFYEHAELVGVPVPLGGYRVTGQQKSVDNIDQYYTEALAVLDRYQGKGEAHHDQARKNQLEDKRWVIDYDLLKRKRELKRWGWPLPEALEKSPKVSIITVCGDSAEAIGKTIESVIVQRYTEIECIVIDRSSGEEVKGVIERGYRKFVDHFVRDPGISPSRAMNLGVRAATGEILFFLDAECYLTDEKVVADVVRLFTASPDVDAVFGNGLLETGHGVVHMRQLHEANPSYLARKSIPLQTLFVRKRVFQNTGEFSETCHSGNGYDWILNLFLKCRTRYRYIDREISVRVESSPATSQQESGEHLRIIKKHYSRVEIFRYRTVPKGMSMIKDMVKCIRGRAGSGSFPH